MNWQTYSEFQIDSRFCNNSRGFADNTKPPRVFMAEASLVDSLGDIDIPKTNLLLAEFVKWCHSGIVLFTAIGWILPWPKAWILLLILVPLMKFHWVTNNGICALTTLEHKLRGNPNAGNIDQVGFVFRFVSLILGKYSPPQEKVNNFAEICMYIGWVIAVARLFYL